jgi:hypothetical protein
LQQRTYAGAAGRAVAGRGWLSARAGGPLRRRGRRGDPRRRR